MSRNRRAFTLIELLVVIAIIAILAALLFPVFSNAKSVSKKSVCLSNMRQLGTAFALYLNDSEGVYPSCDNDKAKIDGKPPEPETPELDGPAERDWHIVLQPYLKNFGILRCPNDSSKKPADAQNPNLGAGEYVASYTVNAWSEFLLSEGAVTSPSNWVLLAERNNVARGPKTWWMFNWWVWQGSGTSAVWPPTLSPDPLPNAKSDLALERDSGRTNWLFGDTHAKSVPFNSLWGAGDKNRFWPKTQ